MKSKSDLSKELNKNYSLKEKILVEIAELYFNHIDSKNPQSLSRATEKSELLKKLNERITEVEKEFISATH